MRNKRRHAHEEAELDITSFMNLMIILVPVLLMSMVFSHISVLDLQLPDLSSPDAEQVLDDLQNQQVELVIRSDYMDINFPSGTRVQRIQKTETGDYDFPQVSQVLQDIKRRLASHGIEKNDILLLSEHNTDYQTIVTTMDTVRSFKAVVAASVVDAELFPMISLGDAPRAEAQP